MSSRASSTVRPLVRTYSAPSPSTRDSSLTDRTRSFLCVIWLARFLPSGDPDSSLRAAARKARWPGGKAFAFHPGQRRSCSVSCGLLLLGGFGLGAGLSRRRGPGRLLLVPVPPDEPVH